MPRKRLAWLRCIRWHCTDAKAELYQEPAFLIAAVVDGLRDLAVDHRVCATSRSQRNLGTATIAALVDRRIIDG